MEAIIITIRSPYYFYTQDRPMAMPGDDVPVTITLQHDIPVEPEQRFTLRDDHKTIGMGIITGVIT